MNETWIGTRDQQGIKKGLGKGAMLLEENMLDGEIKEKGKKKQDNA